MTETTDLYTLTEPLTKDELDTALLEMTGDLDKAQVLHNTLPRWMLKAPLPALTALEDTYRRSSVMRRNLEQRLNRLQSLDQFCIEKLSRYLTENGHPQLDVRCDYLERPRRDPVGVTYITGLLIETLALEKHSLVLSAMQNFSETEAKPGGLPDKTLIREGLHDAEATGITAQQFVGYCRALDLGNAYQEHVREVFDLPAPGESPSGPHYAEALSDVGFSKKADMLVDLHMALAKQHISQVNHTRLLNLINANMAVDWVVKSKSDGKPLIWQGLKIAKACLWSVLVFSEDTLGELAADKFIIYMPNDPVRPWFEYASLESFKQYLTSKLKEKPYLEFFERYLDELERLKFLSDFKSDPTLGVFESIITKGNFCDFFFRSCVGKIQLDARARAGRADGRCGRRSPAATPDRLPRLRAGHLECCGVFRAGAGPVYDGRSHRPVARGGVRGGGGLEPWRQCGCAQAFGLSRGEHCRHGRVCGGRACGGDAQAQPDTVADVF